MSMAVLFWITLGILAGAIAKLLVWENASWSAVLPLGSLGAIAGGVVAGLLSPNSDVPGFDTASIVLALLGAAVLLWPGGNLVLELGYDSAPHVRALLENSPAWTAVEITNDLAGIPRVISAERTQIDRHHRPIATCR